jgi:hypothetical protein
VIFLVNVPLGLVVALVASAWDGVASEAVLLDVDDRGGGLGAGIPAATPVVITAHSLGLFHAGDEFHGAARRGGFHIVRREKTKTPNITRLRRASCRAQARRSLP